MRLLSALLLAVFFSLPARADSQADEADFRFRRGAALYREGKTEEALGEFLASNRLVGNRNVAFNIARCFEQLKRFNEAFRWYAEILATKDLPEADRKPLEAAIQRMAPSLALLRVESDPPGATVYLERKDLGGRGQTPLMLALPPGKVKVLQELDGYRPTESEAQAAIGSVAEVSVRLQRILGTLTLQGDPAEFELRLDAADGDVALEKGGSLALPPGPHRLYVSAPGHIPQALDARVPPDGEVRVSFKLQPLPPPAGGIIVRANLDGAVVRVDGKDAGFTPASVENVRVGTHKLEVIQEGREPFTAQVVVKADERTQVEVKLRYALPRVQAAERKLTRTEDAPASISIITSAEIRGFGYTTLAEALRSVRGLFITDDRNYVNVGVRGYSAPGTYNNKFLVLSDGHITNDLSLGQGFIGRDFDTDLNDVERIEIVRGPGSVLYGSAALLAVINVVHRTPALGLHAGGGATFLDESAASATASWGGESRWASLHAGVFRDPGEAVFRSPVSANAFAQNVDGEDAAHADLRARFDDFGFTGSINQRRKQVPTGSNGTVFGQPGTDTDDLRWFGELTWAHAFNWGGSVDARVSLDGRRHDADLALKGVGSNGLPDLLGHHGTNGRLADWADAELRLSLPPFLGNRIFVGAEALDVFRVNLSSFTPADSTSGLTTAPDITYSETVFSAYVSDDLRLGSRAQLDAAVRIDDHHGSFGTTVNPRLALITQPYEGGNFKLMYGSAYRAPSFYERYFQAGSEVPGNSCGPQTCQTLLPEDVKTGEFEHEHKLGDATSLLLAGYWSRLANTLRLTSFGAPPGKFWFGNRDSLTLSSGLEAEARWSPEPGALVEVWYAWEHVFNQPVFDTVNNRQQRNVVPNVPSHTAALRILWPVAQDLLSVSTEVIYNSGRYTIFLNYTPDGLEHNVGEQVIWNVGFTGTLGRRGPRFTLTVQDLLDQRPLLPVGFEVPFTPRAVTQPGRTFRATIYSAF